MKQFLSRRRWLIGAGGLGGATGCFAYGSLFERNRITRESVVLSLHPGHEALAGRRIAQLSDLHYDDLGDPGMIREAVERTNAEKPDLVFLTGDFISHDPGVLDELSEHLSELRASLGCYAVLGNHDHWSGSALAARFLAKSGIRLLREEWESIAGFTIVGLDSAWGGNPDVEAVLARAPRDAPILLAWHEPDTFDWYEDDRVALQLSGHSHGGQIRAPFVGPLILSRYGRKYRSGLFHRGSSRLYVNRGIGVITIPARFLCPPEITILDLKAKSAD